MKKLVIPFALIYWLIFVIFIFGLCKYGFDFTDEGFYLNNIAYPLDWRKSSLFFGLLFNPVYEIFNHDIHYLRIANVCITYILTWVYLFTILKKFELDRKMVWFVSAFMAMAILPLFRFFFTPNYNSLTYQGMITVLIGLEFAKNEIRNTKFASFLIAFGGMMVFMAKISSAALIAIYALLTLVLSSKRWKVVLGWSIFWIMLFLISLIMIVDGSIIVFVERFIFSIAQMKILGGGHDLVGIIRWDILIWSLVEKKFIFFTGLIFFLTFNLTLWGSNYIKLFTLILNFAVMFLTMGLLLGFIDFPALLINKIMLPLSFFTLFIITAISLIIFIYVKKRQSLIYFVRRYFSLFILCLALNFIFIFGTIVNYWKAATFVSFFSVFLLMLLIAEMSKLVDEKIITKLYYALVSMTLFISTTSFLSLAVEKPYRQPQNIRKYSKLINVGGGELKVSDEWHMYYQNISSSFFKNGFKHGDYVIDMTGRSPGALYAIGAHPVGAAWLLSGYKGSEDFALGFLQIVPREIILKSWILLGEKGGNALPESIFKKLDVNMDECYEFVAEIDGPLKKTIQKILKPRDNNG